MSMRTNAGFPDSLLTRIKNALSALTGRVTTNETDISELKTNLNTTNGKLNKFIEPGSIVKQDASISFNHTSPGLHWYTTGDINKAGYYPVAVSIKNVSFSYVDSGFDKGFGIAYLGFTTQQNGKCKIECQLGGTLEHTQQGSIALQIIWIKTTA